ncbi:hypothetical protein BDR26DRAFT_865291 [Obelidium mucronatum]|nr:hypothetical protein BDR26DRAFT_865291 [Obelidium mucronatum]
MRLIPLTIDVLIASTIFAAVLRIGGLQIRLERFSNFAVRWLLLQILFLGDSVIDAAVNFAKQYPEVLESKFKREEEQPKPATLTTAALSGLASALGINGSSVKDERRWREGSPQPGLQPNLNSDGVKKRSSSHGRQ